MEPITVLSLFDGISCGQLALKRANIPVKKYYASEIDKYAIQVTQKNWPDTIQIGDVKNVWARNLPKIDLLIGGSPCQDLSIAKNDREGLKGKRSSLFWHYVRLLRTCKPKWFLLENVASMPKESKEIITREIGVEPILINSALLSAQQRKRLYWTNIPVTQPEDKGIVLKDILEKSVQLIPGEKAMSVPEATKKGYAEIMPGDCVDLTQMSSKTRRGRSMKEKSNCLTTGECKFYQYVGQPKRLGGFYGQVTRWGIYGKEGKSPTLTASMGMGGGFVPMVPERLGNIEGQKDNQANRIYSVRGKSVSLNANGGGGGAKTGLYKIDLPDGDYIIRKLTPLECERLQTLPNNYTAGISDTQRYKCIGNGWTVDVIAHIFKGME
jgi:DNA (cytosine-5)-methyltransferase 3A